MGVCGSFGPTSTPPTRQLPPVTSNRRLSAIEAIAIQRMAHLSMKKGPADSAPHDGMGPRAPASTSIPGQNQAVFFYRSRNRSRGRRDLRDRCSRKIIPAVTLGARHPQRRARQNYKRKRHPTLEDDVTIYPNSTVLGGETVIGARSTIGGNVFLIQSVPPDSLVYYEETQLQIVHKRGAGARDFTA